MTESAALPKCPNEKSTRWNKDKLVYKEDWLPMNSEKPGYREN